MARYNPENKPVEEFIASIEDHSWIRASYDPQGGDATLFTLSVESDMSVYTHVCMSLEELPKMIKELTAFKEQLEKQGVKLEGGTLNE